MIVSYKHQFVFLKSRKTAGTSIQEALAAQCGSGDFITKTTYEPKGDRDAIQRKRKLYAALKTGAIQRQNLAVSGSADRGGETKRLPLGHASAKTIKRMFGDEFDRFLKIAFVRNPWELVTSRFLWNRARNRHDYDSFPKWLAEDYCKSPWPGRDQLHQYTHIENQRCADFIGRYERLTEDWQALCQRIGLPFQPLPRKKALTATRPEYQSMYDAESVDIVASLFAKDIALFDYRFER
jgi:hypothetical protein